MRALGSVVRSWKRLTRPLPRLAGDEEEPFYEGYWAERLAREPDRTTTAPVRAALVARYVKPGDSLLDIGCGDGSFLAYLTELLPGLSARGADVSNVALEAARKRGLDVFQHDFGDRASIEGEYDVVTLLEVIEHVADSEALVRAAGEAARRLVIVSVPNLGFVENRLRLLFGRTPIDNVVHDMREHLRHWTVHDFEEWAKQLGFELLAKHPTRAVRALDAGRRMPSLLASGMLYVLRPPDD